MPPRFPCFIAFLFFSSNVILADKNEGDSREKNQKFKWSYEVDKTIAEPQISIGIGVNLGPNEGPKATSRPSWTWWPHSKGTTVLIPTSTPPTTSVPTTTSTTTSQPSTTSKPVYILKPTARKALRNSLRGCTPEKRKKQLKQMGKKIKVEKITKTQSNKLHKTYKKVNVSQNPPALDMFEVNERAGLNDYLFQGDMNLDDAQITMLSNQGSSSSRKKRQIQNSANFWPNNIVYWYFDSSLGSYMQSIVVEAMAFLEAKTCVTFQQNSTAPNRVRIFNGVGCYSSIGMVGGEQTLSLGSGCDMVGIAAHELSHTLGVFHNQMRYDRDDYVTVDLTDVPVSSQNNFVKFTRATSTNLVTYEYGSFMHYGGRAFTTSGGVDSIVPKEAKMVYTMGGRIITFLDIKMLNTHYTCSCPTTLTCGNGGYPNPANCNECLCPYGYAGTLCTGKANYTCGSILTATDTWQSETYRFGNQSNSATARPNFIYCNHWIKAPVGKQIQFRIDSTYNTQCGYGCTFNGVEPKLKTDQTITQVRYCCDEFNSQIMTSEVNPLPVFSYNRYYVTDYTWSYRYVDANATLTCLDTSDQDTCTALKAANDQGCSVYDTAQLKVMCAATMDLCGQRASTNCADRFSAAQCSKYSSNGMCTSQSPLVSEFACASTCGFCINPV